MSSISQYHYHEWLCKTNFSFLIGASHPRDIVTTAIKLGYSSLGINDFDGVYGIARTYREVKKLQSLEKTTCERTDELKPSRISKINATGGFKLNYGAEIHFAKDHDRPVLWWAESIYLQIDENVC